VQPDDKPAFLATLNGLAAVKPGGKLPKEAYEIWWQAMQPWSIEEFKQAAAHLALAVEFMPGPYHFDQLRKAGRPTAAEAWECARKAAGSAIQCGQVTHNGTCGDELIDRAVRGIGGYGVIAMCETEKLPFIERRFAEHYDSLQDVEDVRDAVPKVTRGTKRQLHGPTSVSAMLPGLSDRLEPP
jgi:hypothetical protein